MPGSCHDARVLRTSALYDDFNDGYRPFPKSVILGDSAFPLLPWLVPMLADGKANAQRFYRAHAKTRRIVENAFGLLKQRFRCLLDELRVKSPTYAAQIAKACFYLHNFLTEHRLDEEHDDSSFEIELDNTNFDNIDDEVENEASTSSSNVAKQNVEFLIRTFTSNSSI